MQNIFSVYATETAQKANISLNTQSDARAWAEKNLQKFYIRRSYTVCGLTYLRGPVVFSQR